MKYRTLGNTGIQISEIGFGAWGIGGLTAGKTSYGKTDDAISRAALNTALELGINFFDTANVYGNGHSERLIGELIAAQGRDAVIVSTKVGCTDYQEPLDFAPDAITSSLHASLQRLGCEMIDLLMLHDPLPDTPRLDETFERLTELQRGGKIRAIGVSLRTPDHIPIFLNSYNIDAFQVNFNLLDQRLVTGPGLARALASNTAVIARTPLCFGFLSGQIDASSEFDKSDHRSRWSPRQIEMWRSGSSLYAERLTDSGRQTLVQAAIRFCLSFDSVVSVIPGIMTPAEASESASASGLGSYSEYELADIREIYDTNAFFDGRPAGKLAME